LAAPQPSRSSHSPISACCRVPTSCAAALPSSASGSRTPVAEAAGAKTQATGVVAALIVAGLLLFAPQALRNTPQAALAAVVFAACLGLLEVRGVRRLYRLRPSEFVQSIVCLIGVALLGVVSGIGIALGLAILAFLWRAWRPYSAVLERMKGYHDIVRHPEAPHSRTRAAALGRAAFLHKRGDFSRTRARGSARGAFTTTCSSRT
jgi:MFS superfamily sulfate permease-like transporter